MQSFQDAKGNGKNVSIRTPTGIVEKAALTGHFLARKMRGVEVLKAKIRRMREDMKHGTATIQPSS